MTALNVGGNGELIEAGVTGELVTVADPEAMARQIAALATDPQRARLAGLAGRARVEQQFSLQAMSQGYQGLYERLLAS